MGKLGTTTHLQHTMPSQYLWWKPVTYLIGLTWLIYGALNFGYSDWDIPISLIMSLSTYLTADHFIQAIKEKSPTRALIYGAGAWWSIDGCYYLYWSLVDSSAMLREGQWAMSLCLYLLCGLVWTAFPAEKLPTVLPQLRTDPDQPGSD